MRKLARSLPASLPPSRQFSPLPFTLCFSLLHLMNTITYRTHTQTYIHTYTICSLPFRRRKFSLALVRLSSFYDALGDEDARFLLDGGYIRSYSFTWLNNDLAEVTWEDLKKASRKIAIDHRVE